MENHRGQSRDEPFVREFIVKQAISSIDPFCKH